MYYSSVLFFQTNVEGRNCDRCRPGTFSLSEKHIEGCLECFCSGVTDTCQQANLYKTQIPMQVVDSAHGFTLTDRYASARFLVILTASVPLCAVELLELVCFRNNGAGYYLQCHNPVY